MAEIKVKLFQKNFTTAPRRISPAIQSLCQEINPDAEPVVVPVKPDKDAIPSECFNNVPERIKRDGGNMVYGWTIWEWSRVFIEAEHHAVWEKDGKLVDVTPKENAERKIVFLPDPSATYDYEGQKRRINIKRRVGKFESIDKWIAETDRFQKAIEDNSIGNEAHFSEYELQAYQQAIVNAKAEVLLDLAFDTKPRERCICASGKEFRKCCAKLIRFQT